MKRWKTAIIGYGASARVFHAPLIQRVAGLELVGFASRDPQTRGRIEQEQQLRAYDGLEGALADPQVELVILATPHDTHAPMAVAALDAGKHVVTDKVMCLNLGEYEQMRQAAQRSGRLLTVYHNRRWDGDFLTVRKLLAEGRIGEVRWLELSWSKFGLWRSWRGSRARGGGRVYDLGAHLIDQALLLVGKPAVRVHAEIQREWLDADVESQAMITIVFEGGARAVIDVGCLTRYAKPRFHVVGPNGTFVKFGIDPQEAALKAGDLDSAREPEAEYGRLITADGEEIIPTETGRWLSFYENVVDALNGKAQPAVTLEQMRQVIAVIDAAFESERIGRPVEL
mgnify:CR=1 FL=1